MSSRNLRSDERGVALVIALFMTMMVSALAASMAYVARTETLSSQSYTTMAHARYGAESGLAAATNYLLSTPYAVTAPGTGPDPLANYDTNFSPVRRANAAVVLSSVGGGSNYPVGAVVTAFGAAAAGTLTAGNATVTYGARATLLGLRRVTDSMSGNTETLQKWEVTGWGSRGGIGSSEVEVTAIVERQIIPLYRYAAFATNTGCGALSFSGGAKTKSYNSQALNAGNPVPAQHRRRRRHERQPRAVGQSDAGQRDAVHTAHGCGVLHHQQCDRVDGGRPGDGQRRPRRAAAGRHLRHAAGALAAAADDFGEHEQQLHLPRLPRLHHGRQLGDTHC